MTSKYANGCPDKSANGLFKLCEHTGPISTISKTPGLVVWQSGHIGISLDGEYAIEARGFKYGVVLTKIKNRTWEKWGKLPASIIDYVADGTETIEPAPVNADGCPYAEPVRNQRKGSVGEGVKWIQWLLIQCGYGVGGCGIDGDFGKATHAAVIRFQADNRLEKDGIVGPLTRAALKAEYDKKKGA